MRQPPASADTTGRGQPVGRLPVFLCLAWLLAAPVPAAVDQGQLKELVELARAGAPQLALARLQQLQPAPDKDLVGWMAWERERIHMLEAKRAWVSIRKRLETLPAGVPDDFRRWALTRRAAAEIEDGAVVAARATLRSLLWHVDDLQLGDTAAWRRMVVRTYLKNDLLEDARTALLRYRLDFGDGNPEWRWLAARVELRTGHPQAALALVADEQRGVGKVLQLIARLHTRKTGAGAIEAEASELAAREDTPPGVRGLLLGVAAEAAAVPGPTLEHVRYLEQALAQPYDEEIGAHLLGLDPDRLWNAYLELGKQWGNREQRLLGRDEDWYFPAVEVMEKEPLRARILFAVLAEYGTEAQRRSLAHEYLVSLLEEEPGGKRVVERLYLESGRYRDPARLPRVIRYRLIDQALEKGDLATASRLMAGLKAPPSGTGRFEWDLRRARVAIFTGDLKGGVRLLEGLLDGEELDGKRVDRLLQVVFDLQTVQQHKRALALFDRLLARPLDLQQRRELLFWKADSWEALGRHDRAAWFYLKSATLGDPLAMDPWAQTARYRAAKALVGAGYLDDARQIYHSLLRATRDKARQAVLQGELQRLRLLATRKPEQP